MSENVVSEKFINYYYNKLAYEPQKLLCLYGKDSKVVYHDVEREQFSYIGADQIMEGMKKFSLPNSITNLEKGSIDCINCSPDEYLLSIIGRMKINSKDRDFSQIFLLARKQSTKVVIYVKSEILTLLPINEEFIEEETTKKDSEFPLNKRFFEKKEDRKMGRDSFPRRSGSSGTSGTSTVGGNASLNKETAGNQSVKEEEERGKSPYEIIFVRNLSEEAVEGDLRAAFEVYGSVNQVKLFATKNYATVSFRRDESNTNHDVYDAIMKDGKEISIHGKTVHIEPYVFHKKQSYEYNKYPSSRNVHYKHSFK